MAKRITPKDAHIATLRAWAMAHGYKHVTPEGLDDFYEKRTDDRHLELRFERNMLHRFVWEQRQHGKSLIYAKWEISNGFYGQLSISASDKLQGMEPVEE